MSYLGDIPETYFKQSQLIHWLALLEEYRDPSTESALAQKLGVNRSRARVRSSRGFGFLAKASTLHPRRLTYVSMALGPTKHLFEGLQQRLRGLRPSPPRFLRPVGESPL